MRIGAVIPTYNERDNVATLIQRLNSIVPGIAILIVDDHSPDGTATVVRELQTRFPKLDLLVRPGKLGFGSAYMDGLRRLIEDPSLDAALMMDADLSHDPAAVPAMIERLASCDAVIGSRYTRRGRIQGWGPGRRLLSLFGNLYARTVTGMPFRDCTAGFLLLRRAVVDKLLASPVRMIGYAFLMEIKHNIWQWNFRIAEVPIIFRERRFGLSKISNSIIREGLVAPWHLRARRFRPQNLTAPVAAAAPIRPDSSR